MYSFNCLNVSCIQEAVVEKESGVEGGKDGGEGGTREELKERNRMSAQVLQGFRNSSLLFTDSALVVNCSRYPSVLHCYRYSIVHFCIDTGTQLTCTELIQGLYCTVLHCSRYCTCTVLTAQRSRQRKRQQSYRSVEYMAAVSMFSTVQK